MPFLLGRGQLGLDPVSPLPQSVDSTTSSELLLFQQCIRDLPGNDDPTSNPSHGTTAPIPDQRSHSDHARKDNSLSVPTEGGYPAPPQGAALAAQRSRITQLMGEEAVGHRGPPVRGERPQPPEQL